MQEVTISRIIYFQQTDMGSFAPDEPPLGQHTFPYIFTSVGGGGGGWMKS